MLWRTYYTVVLLFSFRCSNCEQEPKRGLRHCSGLKTGRAAAAGVAVLFFSFLGPFLLQNRRRERSASCCLPLLPSSLRFPRGLLFLCTPPFQTQLAFSTLCCYLSGTFGTPVTGGCQGPTHRLPAPPDQWEMPWKRQGVLGWRGLADPQMLLLPCVLPPRE